MDAVTIVKRCLHRLEDQRGHSTAEDSAVRRDVKRAAVPGR